MGSRYVRSGGVAVELGGGGGQSSDQFPGDVLNDGVDTATSTRPLLSAIGSATPFTAGTYTVIRSALSAAAGGVCIVIPAETRVSGADSSTFIEIATGAASSEVVWATVSVGWRMTDSVFFVPGYIASGARVTFRVRSAVVSKSIAAYFTFLPATRSVIPGAPITWGANTGTAQGVSLTAPGSINTKSAWTEITGSTSATVGQLLVCPGANADTGLSSTGVLLDIGVGAAAAEAAIITDMFLDFNSNESIGIRGPTTFGVAIPAGSRISGRWARAATGNSGLDILLVGA